MAITIMVNFKIVNQIRNSFRIWRWGDLISELQHNLHMLEKILTVNRRDEILLGVPALHQKDFGFNSLN